MINFEPSKNETHFNAIFIESHSITTLKSDKELLESLIALPHDINFNFVDNKFNNILYLAAANNKIKTVSYLLCERRVDPNMRGVENSTAAHIASINGYTHILTLLANRHNIDLTLQDQFGETPLFRALGNAPKETVVATVQFLIKKEPRSIFIGNEDGMMPIELALMKKYPVLVKVLIDHGAEISERCCSSASQMLIERSKKSTKGYSIFNKSSAENNDLLECAKLIIAAYNENHPILTL